MTAEQRRRAVEEAYDELGPRFGEWTAKIEAEPSERFLRELSNRLPEGARVLDPSCTSRETTMPSCSRRSAVG
jgi:hypothetical protein